MQLLLTHPAPAASGSRGASQQRPPAAVGRRTGGAAAGAFYPIPCFQFVVLGGVLGLDCGALDRLGRANKRRRTPLERRYGHAAFACPRMMLCLSSWAIWAIPFLPSTMHNWMMDSTLMKNSDQSSILPNPTAPARPIMGHERRRSRLRPPPPPTRTTEQQNEDGQRQLQQPAAAAHSCTTAGRRGGRGWPAALLLLLASAAATTGGVQAFLLPGFGGRAAGAGGSLISSSSASQPLLVRVRTYVHLMGGGVDRV